MATPKRWHVTVSAAALLVAGTPAVVASAGPGSTSGARGDRAVWAGSWAAAVTRGNATGLTNTGLNNQSVRMVVHTSVGGPRLRVRLSNVYGEQAVRVGRATIARPNTATADDHSDIDPASLRELRFNGAASATMNRGAELLSDPVDFPVGDQQDLVLTVHFPTPTGPVTFHGQSRQTNFIGATDLTSAADGAGFTIRPNCCWFFLSGIDVQRRHSPGSVVVLGDSIGDGNGSTVNANRRWPDLLADRLIDARPDVRTPGVLNLSLAGNRLNHEGPEPGAGGFPGYHELGPNAVSRLDEDVFAQTDARTVVTHLGINDIWMSGDSAEQVIAALRQINQQVKARGLRSLVATLTPYEGHGNPGVWTPEKEATRQAVNAWLRAGDEFDGLLDFDRVLRDPAQPSRLLPAYDSGDHIHPNDAGNQAMADAVPLRLLGL
ncbi:SGNH/GDSL hydrolase family protein [Micromonospora sp. C28SCA-DRY-2]|uniref:SGNH/GDSL hydrolase family protein n=1 Tax=Micromonospora sp. C28SCA-DRY-2 TaxID=3059522 RepID=UPI0026761C30|nr:SGNH/GDSL hydrolase family protein [Micromonospora sp. C28SCA-DRY-2]MDO3705293.1 SGNH/GDSL hydrolase family protein [Micromonospora sp. C28SCA-DRY-2]